MNVTRLIYGLLITLLLSSCSQMKALTLKDSSTVGRPSKKTNSKKVRFLDISVSPGQVVTSSHDMSTSVPSYDIRKIQRDVYNANLMASVASGNIERADWLQLKYAILLDATVETLSNVSLLKLIDEWWGTSYCMGGSSKDCIDCSAFTQMVMQNVYNVNVPRTAQEQYNSSQQINTEDLSEGDLVFFSTRRTRDITHVGIYLLNNKFVHAATSGGVMVSDLNDIYWKPRYRSAGRYVTTPPSSTTSYNIEGMK